MITFRASTEVPADRRIVLTLPPETPVGTAELMVTVTSQPNVEARRGSLRESFGAIHSGDPGSANNERIDADLGNAYDIDPA